MRASAFLLRPLVGALAIITACSTSGTEPSSIAPGIHFVAGSGTSDTIGSVLPQALVVEIRDQNGQVVPGVIVRFESILSPTPGFYGFPEFETLVGRLDQPSRTTFVSDTTDAKGQATALVQLGTRAGVARAAVMAPIYGFVDTAKFTVRPGNAARITLSVRDTATVLGAAYSLGAAASDRAGNPRPTDVLTYLPTTPNVVSVDAGGAVKTLDVGRGVIAVRAGTFTDTTWVSVVPDLTLAVVSTRSAVRSLATIKLDGSQFTPVTTVASEIAMPRWNPAGTRIAFYEGNIGSPTALVHIVDRQGARAPFLGTLPQPANQFFPRYSADGQWLYFSGIGSYTWASWRAHVDGSGVELLADSHDASYQVSPSPDGARVAYQDGGVIMTMDLATRVVTSLAQRGDFPEYSPDGTQILFLAGFEYLRQLAIMNADGTNVRTLARGFDMYSSPSWSPDGKWIVVGGSRWDNSIPVLVNAATLEVIPVKTLWGLQQAAIKP